MGCPIAVDSVFCSCFMILYCIFWNKNQKTVDNSRIRMFWYFTPIQWPTYYVYLQFHCKIPCCCGLSSLVALFWETNDAKRNTTHIPSLKIKIPCGVIEIEVQLLFHGYRSFNFSFNEFSIFQLFTTVNTCYFKSRGNFPALFVPPSKCVQKWVSNLWSHLFPQ